MRNWPSPGPFVRLVIFEDCVMLIRNNSKMNWGPANLLGSKPELDLLISHPR